MNNFDNLSFLLNRKIWSPIYSVDKELPERDLEILSIQLVNSGRLKLHINNISNFTIIRSYNENTNKFISNTGKNQIFISNTEFKNNKQNIENKLYEFFSSECNDILLNKIVQNNIEKLNAKIQDCEFRKYLELKIARTIVQSCNIDIIRLFLLEDVDMIITDHNDSYEFKQFFNLNLDFGNNALGAYTEYGKKAYIFVFMGGDPFTNFSRNQNVSRLQNAFNSITDNKYKNQKKFISNNIHYNSLITTVSHELGHYADSILDATYIRSRKYSTKLKNLIPNAKFLDLIEKDKINLLKFRN